MKVDPGTSPDGGGAVGGGDGIKKNIYNPFYAMKMLRIITTLIILALATFTLTRKKPKPPPEATTWIKVPRHITSDEIWIRM